VQPVGLERAETSREKNYLRQQKGGAHTQGGGKDTIPIEIDSGKRSNHRKRKKKILICGPEKRGRRGERHNEGGERSKIGCGKHREAGTERVTRGKGNL